MRNLELIAYELGEELARSLSNEDVDRIIRQQGDDQLLPAKTSKENKISEHIRRPDHDQERIEIIEAYVNQIYPKQLSGLNNIIGDTPYVFDYVGDNIKIIEKRRRESKEEKQEHTTYIEENASANTLDSLKSAKNKLAKSDYGGTCEDLRHALESMVDKDWSYREGLDELVSKKLIQQEDEQTRDSEALYFAYSYNSEVGSHKKSTDYTPYREQAEFSILLTEETIYFLLKRIDKAKQKGVKIERWNT
jgi:hypothetical protein